MKAVSRFLLETNATLLSVGVLLLRFATGTVLMGIASGKAFGWFGGPGLETTVQFYAGMGFPAPLAYLSTFTELVGGFLLLVGLLTRPAALAVMINLVVATIVTIPLGLFTAAGFPFALLTAVVVIQLAGPLAYSVDALLQRQSEVIHEPREQEQPIRIGGANDEKDNGRWKSQLEDPGDEDDRDQMRPGGANG